MKCLNSKYILNLAAKKQISWVCLPSGGHHSLLFDQGFPNNSQLQPHLANRNTIWQYFVSMRLYLAMLFILLIQLEFQWCDTN